MCLISLLYVEARGSVKFKSICLLREERSCGTPCESFQGQDKSWNQENLKSERSQYHSKTRLKQIPDTSQGHVGRVWKSLAKRLQEGP